MDHASIDLNPAIGPSVCVPLESQGPFWIVCFVLKLQGARGQQGVHSSAANEDGCGYSVKQIGIQSVYVQFHKCDVR